MSKRCTHVESNGFHRCGSYAFNLEKDGIEQGDLCDVHYWQDQALIARAKLAEQPAQQEPVAWGIIASNTGRLCQVELDADEVEGHNPKHIVPLCHCSQAPVQEPTVAKAAYNRLRDDYNDLVNRSEQDAKDAKEWRAHVNRCKLAGVDLDYQTTTPQAILVKLAAQPAQRTWVGLMRGVRVEGDTLVITVKGGNDAARELCGALLEVKNT